MSTLKTNAAQWLLALALILGFCWLTGTKIFGPRPWASVSVPEHVLDGFLVLPPNYTNFAFSAREMIAHCAKRGFTARWERQGAERYVLIFGGENKLTGTPLDIAFQLRPVAGPHEIVSQVIGFTGPAVVIESMAEQGVVANGSVTTNFVENMQMALAQDPATRLYAIVKAQRPPAADPAPSPAPSRRTFTDTDRPVLLTPTVPR